MLSSGAALAAPSAQGPSGPPRPQVPIRDDAGRAELTVQAPERRLDKQRSKVTPLSPEATAGLLKRLEPLPDLSHRKAQAPIMRAPTAQTPAQPIAFAAPAGKRVDGQPLTPQAAPAKAEEMYTPETFGRSSGEIDEVVDY